MRVRVASRQLSVVSRDGRVGAVAANRFQVAVQLRAQLIDQGPERLHILLPKKTSTVGAPQEMFGLVEGTSGGTYKAFVFSVTPPPITLGEVRSDAVGGAHHRRANRAFGQPVRVNDKLPDSISDFLRQSIDPQGFQSWISCPANIKHPIPLSSQTTCITIDN